MSIKQFDGAWVKGQGNIQNTTEDYFSSLFNSIDPPRSAIQEITKKSYLSLLEESKSLLDREFSDEEIKKSGFSDGQT